MSKHPILIGFGIFACLLAVQGVLIAIAANLKDLLVARDVFAGVMAIMTCEWGVGPFMLARWSLSRQRQPSASRLARVERIAGIAGAQIMALLFLLSALSLAFGASFRDWLSNHFFTALLLMGVVAATAAVFFLIAGAAASVRAARENTAERSANTTAP
jgi:hypothetical protein